MTPTSAMCDESSRSTLNVLGWHNETVKMDVASTNADGYFHSDNTTSHQSGFHPLRALLDRVSVRFDATYDDRGYSSGWVGNVRLAQNYPQAVQYVSAPAVSYQQQVQEVDGGNVSVGVAGGGYQVMGYDAFGVAIYVSPSYPGGSGITTSGVGKHRLRGITIAAAMETLIAKALILVAAGSIPGIYHK